MDVENIFNVGSEVMFGIVFVSVLFDILNICKFVKYINLCLGIVLDKELLFRFSCVNGEFFLNKSAGMLEYSVFDCIKRYCSVFSLLSIVFKCFLS